MKYDIEYIEKIAAIVVDKGLSEIVLEDGEELISVRKDCNCATAVAAPMVTATPVVQAAPAIQNAQPVEKMTAQEPEKKGKAITSPMVGAFYAAPSPGAKPFVKVGDVVSTGQVVCIVEAMKLMNEIESEVSGKITQICVEDGQSVEYGQVLMYVE